MSNGFSVKLMYSQWTVLEKHIAQIIDRHFEKMFCFFFQILPPCPPETFQRRFGTATIIRITPLVKCIIQTRCTITTVPPAIQQIRGKHTTNSTRRRLLITITGKLSQSKYSKFHKPNTRLLKI